MLAPVQPLDVSLSLSQHELESLQKGKLQRRKPPPLTPVADDTPAQSAAGNPAGIPDLHVRYMRSFVSASIVYSLGVLDRDAWSSMCRTDL